MAMGEVSYCSMLLGDVNGYLVQIRTQSPLNERQLLGLLGNLLLFHHVFVIHFFPPLHFFFPSITMNAGLAASPSHVTVR